MKRNGWDVDVDYSNGEDQIDEFDSTCDTDQFYGYKDGNRVGSISPFFKGSGKANLRFGNCHDTGYVAVLLNGAEIERATIVFRRVSFQYEVGDFLEIKEFQMANIELFSLDLFDGGMF